MTAGQVIQQLTKEGYRLNYDLIHSAIRGGYVDRPPMIGADLAYDFRERHLRQIRHYLKNRPKRGRRPVVPALS